MKKGLAAGLSAFSLDKVDVWDLVALKKRHALLVQHLADRWGFGTEWGVAHRGDNGDDDADHDDDDNEDGNFDAKGGEHLLIVIGFDDAVPMPKSKGRLHAHWCVYTQNVFCVDMIWFAKCLLC